MKYHRRMLRRLGWVSVVAASLWTAGCGDAAVPASVAQSPEAQEARTVLDNLARGDIVAVSARLDESQRSPDPTAALRQMAGFFPSGGIPTRVHLVGFDKRYVKVVGGRATEAFTISFESNYPQANVVSQVIFQRIDGGDLRMLGLNAHPLPAPLAVINAFTLSGKGPTQYVFLLMMIAAAAVTLVAVVVWVRRRRWIRRRWWWLVGILLGAFKITLNWTTGAVAIQALTTQLLSLGYFRWGVDGEWIFALSIPAGAIAFLILQRRPRQTPAGAPPLAPPPPVAG